MLLFELLVKLDGKLIFVERVLEPFCHENRGKTFFIGTVKTKFAPASAATILHSGL